MKRKVIAIVSGGMDSSVLLASLLADGDNVRALTVDYGQRHRREIECASAQAAAQGAMHEVVDASSVFSAIGGSCLTVHGDSVPHGHYAEASMKQTVVPNRNMILLAIAIGVAVREKAGFVAYGAHAGDHAIYPDCRPEFADAMSCAARRCDFNPIELMRPFIMMTKADIVAEGFRRGVDFAKTWSCYEGGGIACGRCGTCVERLEAFDTAGRRDPLEYRDREYWRTACESSS